MPPTIHPWCCCDAGCAYSSNDCTHCPASATVDEWSVVSSGITSCTCVRDFNGFSYYTPLSSLNNSTTISQRKSPGASSYADCYWTGAMGPNLGMNFYGSDSTCTTTPTFSLIQTAPNWILERTATHWNIEGWIGNRFASGPFGAQGLFFESQISAGSGCDGPLTFTNDFTACDTLANDRIFADGPWYSAGYGGSVTLTCV